MSAQSAIGVSTTQLSHRIHLWPLDKLVPYDLNPRTHSEQQVRQIADSIIRFGFVAPILVDEKAGIIAGHGRLDAAKYLNLEQVPVVKLTGLSDALKRAYLIADNRLAENAGWDDDLLTGQLKSLAEDDFDLSVLGFTEDELKNLAIDINFEADELDDQAQLDETKPKNVTCPKCGYEF